MSTRCQVIIRDKYKDALWFYRHLDGYPEGALPTLKTFMGLIKEGKIRDNVEQAAGWLVLLGAQEYGVSVKKCGLDPMMGWKCGAYEPCMPQEHGDIEFLYTLDLEELTITVADTYKKTGYTLWMRDCTE